MSTSSRTPFVGVGTGRCGTHSLCHILNACENVVVGHEGYHLYWYRTNEEVGRLVRFLRDGKRENVLRGNIGQANLPHIAELRSSIKDLPVVCMHRDKDATVESFVRYNGYMIRPRDKRAWIDEQGTRNRDPRMQNGRGPLVARCWPEILNSLSSVPCSLFE